MKGFWCTRHLEMVGILWWAGSGRVGAVPWLARAPLEKCIVRSPRTGARHPNLSQCCSALPQITSWTTHQLLPPHHGMAGLPTWGAYAGGGPATQAAAIFAEAWNGERCNPGACADRGVATRGPKPVLGSGQRGWLLQ